MVKASRPEHRQIAGLTRSERMILQYDDAPSSDVKHDRARRFAFITHHVSRITSPTH
jgi:hypothetical protein